MIALPPPSGLLTAGGILGDDLARLLGRGELADLFSSLAAPPPDWEPVFVLDGLQMLWRGGADPGDPHDRDGGVLELGADGVPEMLDLVARTRPGSFRPRTREMGTYLGIRENGRLVAMAGERPFLHVAEQNTGAIALYERLGFEVRKRVTFRGFRTP